MELSVPTTANCIHLLEEEDEDEEQERFRKIEDEVIAKEQYDEFKLISTMAIPKTIEEEEKHDNLHDFRTLYDISTPTTTPTTRHEPFEMPTFVHYNSNKIESTKENTAQHTADVEPSTNVVLVPCSICNRTFNPVTLSKHVAICQKTATKRRKVFDSSRQRREGTDLATYPVPKNYGLPPQPNLFPKPERSISPQQHTELATPAATRKRTVSQTTPANEDLVRSTARASLRSKPINSHSKATTSTTGNESNFQRDRMRSSERINAKRSQVPQSEQCPYCERCFGIKAYDRHVEWCKEKALQASIKQPNAKHEQNPAMERLQARTKYRAPCLKTKRSINRDKYSGMNSEENESFECNKPATIKNDLMTQSMTSSITSERLQIEDVTYNYNDKQISNEENPGNIRSDEESVKSVKIKKYISKPRNTYTKSMVKLPQLQMQEDAEPLEKISKPKLATKLKKRGKSPVPSTAWMNPDGSLDTMAPPLGLQPRRNCRNKVEVTPTETGNDWQQMFLELEREAKPSTAVRPTRSTNNSPLRNNKATNNPTNVATELSCVPINVSTVNRPKRKSARLMTKKKVNAPMKALPLNQEIYEQMLQINTTEIDVISTEITMELDTGLQVKKSPTTTSYYRTHSPIQLQRSRSFTLSSGKYDPFLSAKRQLEELCSPSTPTTGLVTSQIVHSNSNSTPTTPLPQNKSMTTSLNFATSTPNTRQLIIKGNSNTLQSNFRRTSSLRGPRRSPLLSSRPIFVTNYRPTIQRGLSDEGPISSNFLKPEEYDEMPVRSVCVNDFAMTKSPRVIRRDLNATLNRKPHMKLNLQTNNNNTNNEEKCIEEMSKKLDGKEVCKTDSLAVFLKYERELEQLASQQEESEESKTNVSNNNAMLISKDLKNRSNNALTKQHSLKNVLETNFDKMPLILPMEMKNKSEQMPESNKSEKNKLPQLPVLKTRATAINLQAIFDDIHRTSSENIDPKLINKCDNLSLNFKQIEKEQPQQQQQPQKQQPPTPPPRKQQTKPIQQQQQHPTTPINVGNGNRLKRKMRLGLNQFLYDTSPEELAYETTDSASSEKTNDLPVFDDLDFDFEEFISSFEQDNEQFPLFKDCKEFLSNRKQRPAVTTNSTQLPLIKPLTFQTFSPQQQQQSVEGKREIFISIEAEQNDYGQSPLSPTSLRNIVGNEQTVVEVHEVGASNEVKFSKISDDDDGDADESLIVDSEDNSLPNVQLNNAKNLIQRMQTHFQQFTNETEQKHPQQQNLQPRQATPVHFEDEDSDDLSNGNMLHLTQNTRCSINTKISADSAYGSLSRQRSTESCTPQTRIGHHTRPSTANLPMPTVKVLQQQQQQQFYKTKQNKARSNQYVYKDSSSGSDNSLPAINKISVTNNANMNNYDLQQQQQQQGSRLRKNNSRILESTHKKHNTNNNQTNNNNNNSNNNNSQNNVNESQISEVLMLSSSSNMNLESPMTSSTSSNPSMTSSVCKRMSKFCHECGSKFIVEQAKFCMDCGVKRIIL